MLPPVRPCEEHAPSLPLFFEVLERAVYGRLRHGARDFLIDPLADAFEG